MKRYDTYKDSGVQWLGEIPSHWDCIRLKNLGTCQNGVSKGGEYFGEGFPFVSYSDAYKNIVLPTTVQGLAKSTENDRKTYSVERGDVLFTRTSETIDEIGFASTCLETIKSSVFAGFLIRFRPNVDSIIPEFYKYYFRSMHLRKFFTKEMNIVTRASLSQQLLGQLKVLIPSVEEQKAISFFLDSKCSKIDQLLANKEKEIALLQEMKQRVIADAVTRGLNPEVKMKATGISWLPEVPEHWEIKPIRAILKENTEKSETGAEELLSLSQYTGISYKKDASKVGMFEAESTVGYKMVHSGQFVMNIMLAWNGSYAVSNLDGIISPAYCVFDFITECDKMYFHYLWRLGIYQGVFKTASRGIIDSRLRLYPNKFLPFPTICPPLSEQQAIVSYINERVAKIDTLAAKLQKEIESIKEYKQRLISDVVTGQIKVC